jgi:hypothetical protein
MHHLTHLHRHRVLPRAKQKISAKTKPNKKMNTNKKKGILCAKKKN